MRFLIPNDSITPIYEKFQFQIKDEEIFNCKTRYLAEDTPYTIISILFYNEGGTPNMSATIHNYGYGGSIIVFVLSLFLKTLTIIVVVVWLLVSILCSYNFQQTIVIKYKWWL